MQHITLLCIGHLKKSWAAAGCELYLRRLQPTVKFEVRELSPGKEKDSAKQRSEESEKIATALEKIKGDVWLLDEKGERMTSQEFSFFLGQAKDAGTPLVFVLGGAYGLESSLKKRARGTMRLSDMTLPHELCRVVFLEQLYRAIEIGRGSGYHH